MFKSTSIFRRVQRFFLERTVASCMRVHGERRNVVLGFAVECRNGAKHNQVRESLAETLELECI